MTLHQTLLVQKFKALAAHLSISAVLVGIALWLMLLHWFPAPLFATDGGRVGLQLLLLVDLVLGPLLTFIVFNPSKTRRLLLLDLSVIASLQLMAYGYGLYNIHSVRVQTLAFYQGQFYSVTADRYAEQTVAPADWQALGASAPYLVNVREPADGDEASGMLAFGMTAGLEPYQLQFLYQAIATAAPAVWQAGVPLASLQRGDPVVAAEAATWLREHQQPAETVRFLKLQGYYGSALLAFDQQGHWLGGFAATVTKNPTMPASPSPKS